MKKITTLLNNNCSHTLHHFKVDSLFHWKDRWMAHMHRLILCSLDSNARDATSPLPYVTSTSHSHPLCSDFPPSPCIRTSHASPSPGLPPSLVLSAKYLTGPLFIVLYLFFQWAFDSLILKFLMLFYPLAK